MPLLIDTYNVLHTVGVLPPDLAGLDVPHLIRLLQSSRYRDEKTTLVCDGAPEPVPGKPPLNRVGEISIRYSGKGKPADDLIGQMIRVSTSPRRLTVVSSDHAVLRSARRRRCRTMTSEEFLTELAADAMAADPSIRPIKKPSGGMTEAQVDTWVNVFKVDEQTLSIPSGRKRNEAGSTINAGETAPQDQASEPPPAPPPHTIKQLGRGEGLPLDLIEQAERMWQQEARKEAPPPRGP